MDAADVTAPQGAVKNSAVIGRKAGGANHAASEREAVVGRHRRRPCPSPDERARPEPDSEKSQPDTTREDLAAGDARSGLRLGHTGNTSTSARQGLQRQAQVMGGMDAIVGTLLETAAQEPVERRRHGSRLSRRIVLENSRQRLRAGVALKGRRAHEHLVDHDPQREDVRARIDRLAAHLLGRHVSNRTEQHATAGQLLYSDGWLSGSMRRSSSPAGWTSLASPKSRILTRPSRVTNKFLGVRSR
jgi:hypothetical protein